MELSLSIVNKKKNYEIRAYSSKYIEQLMMNFGAILGSSIKVLHKLPGILICDINQTQIAIRSNDAKHILVSN